MGKLTKLTIVPKLSRVVILLAIISPMHTTPIVIKIIKLMVRQIVYNSSGIPRAIPITRTMNPCSIALVPIPSILPVKTDARLTGATRISFIKPNCRSQITDMPRNMAVKSKA